MKFKPVEDFTWDHNGEKDSRGRPRKSVMLKGYEYRVPYGTEYEPLKKAVQKWLTEGKVELI